jgi:membrane protein
VRLTSENHLLAFSGALAYGTVFALAPILVLIVLSLGVFGAEDLVLRAITELRPLLPAQMLDLLETQLTKLVQTDQSAELGTGLAISALVAIWGASGGMRRMIEALNAINRVEERRRAISRLGLSVILALGEIVLVVLSLAVVVIGDDVAERVFAVVGLGSEAAEIWDTVRWPVLVVFLWIGIVLVYRIGPDQRKIDRVITPGTVIAAGGWALFTAGFSFYVGAADLFSAWGAIAGALILLLYLQYVSLIILLGAQIDVIIAERTSRLAPDSSIN